MVAMSPQSRKTGCDLTATLTSWLLTYLLQPVLLKSLLEMIRVARSQNLGKVVDIQVAIDKMVYLVFAADTTFV